MNIYIVRHGETEWNTTWRLQGRTDIPLNDTGIKQAQLTAKALKAEGIVFDRVYSSPLSRALKTAEILSGFSPEKIIKENRIIEINFGNAEGSTPQERKTNPKFKQINNFFNAPALYNPSDDAESFKQVFARTADFWEKEIRPLENQAENILVVTHGGTLQSLLMHVDGRTLDDYWAVKFPNCSFNLISLKNSFFSVEWTSKIFY